MPSHAWALFRWLRQCGRPAVSTSEHAYVPVLHFHFCLIQKVFQFSLQCLLFLLDYVDFPNICGYLCGYLNSIVSTYYVWLNPFKFMETRFMAHHMINFSKYLTCTWKECDFAIAGWSSQETKIAFSRSGVPFLLLRDGGRRASHVHWGFACPSLEFCLTFRHVFRSCVVS